MKGLNKAFVERMVRDATAGTSVSQAKGRIERLWGSMQSRLVSELALRDIKTIEEANAFPRSS